MANTAVFALQLVAFIFVLTLIGQTVGSAV